MEHRWERSGAGRPKRRETSRDGAGATVASILFSLYVSNFDSYNKTYGSLGAVVILLVWFDLSAYIILLGGEINAEMEHQTTRDTTTGPPARMGERGATMADTVGETP